jgi:hypothetical protein
MLDKEKFKEIEDLISKKNINELRKQLSMLRNNLSIDPDYLYLMANLLYLDNRTYQAIDALLLSLTINFDENFLKNNNFNKSDRHISEKKIKLLKNLFKVLNNKELIKKEISYENQEVFLKDLMSLMPGLKIKKN